MNKKIMVITGATGNLGRAVVEAFVQASAKDSMPCQLVLLGRHQEALIKAFANDNIAPPPTLLAVDVRNPTQIHDAMQTVLQEFGRIDGLIHLVGGFAMGSPTHASDDWDALYDINVRTFLHMIGEIVPTMVSQGSGKIVAVGAHSALSGKAKMGAYCSAKSALMRIVESLSAECRHAGINVNAVLPTIIDGAENRKAMPTADFTRWVSPASLAQVIVFLASDRAQAVHGALVPVTGLVD